MKRVLNHPQPPKEGDAVTTYRSVGEKEGSSSFRNELDKEFPNGDTLTEEEQTVSRRSFTKLMGASTALAGLSLASCRRPESYIVPYKKAPEWIIPGKPLFYASTMPRVGGAVPLLVTTVEGRPKKLEPATDHPDSSGTDALVQASILDLYSPSRSQDILKNAEVSDQAALVEGLKGLDLAATALVFGSDDSPTRNRLAKELARKGVTLVSYEATVGEGLGAGTSTVVDFSKATRILSLDADFLGADPIGNSREFSKGRMGGDAEYKAEIDADKMSRLYQVETQFSITGGMADHRLRVAPSRVAVVAAEIAIKLGLKVTSGISADDKKALFPGGSAAEFDQWVAQCAKDLDDAGAKTLVIAGSRQPKEVHQIAAAINKKLASAGARVVSTELSQYGTMVDLSAKLESGAVKNVVFLTPSDPAYDFDGFAALAEKAEAIVHFGIRTNATAWAANWHVPARHFLESWSDARSASGVLSLIQPMIFMPYQAVSELELLVVLNGGDFPTGEFSPAMTEVKKTFAAVSGKDTDEAWREALKNGFTESSYTKRTADVSGITIPKTAAPSAKNIEVVFSTDASVLDGRFIDNAWLQESPDPVTKLTWDNAAQISPLTAKELGIYDQVVALEAKGSIYGADPFKRAAKPVIGEGEHAKAPFITVTIGERSVKIPVLIAFGHADHAITIPLGYGQACDDGRESAIELNSEHPVVGHVGLNTGFNAYPLRSLDSPYFAVGATIGLTEDEYKVALTQEHNSMYGRALAREVSTNDIPGKGTFKKQIEKVKKQGMDAHAPPNISLYDPKGGVFSKSDLAKKTHLADDIHQWGMAIDLNTCTGCNACLVACQAENNIPVVGKDQVAMGREMHWIRMDRYFASQEYQYKEGHKLKDDEGNKVATPEWVQQNPEMVPQPVACVQCEMAPCETVCPVNATVHTEEGLNSMAYNRCIGTRYCANNCPYKARRFNFFDYNKRNPLIKGNLYKGPFGKKQVGEAPSLQRNPNVTVRMRGVMEKCTYCVQRLEGAKIKQKQQQKQNTLASGLKSPAVSVNRSVDLKVPTNSVKVACQEACPTSAISFGNLLDNNSQVVRAKGNELDSIKIIKGDKFEAVQGSGRNYDLLNYVNTRPRTSYLARVKNPNKLMPDSAFLGQATINTH
ncbi:TAT-variant-translocated molybdopterin oxidoreductase [Akkermansiaceae bacterium]|nr:TAT-variant-translocated molybdopterin oxidoreductase [Akkermansiaceae bacterium]MDA8876171.1 TAT-variant-translocated molybdopterin oxidoreductase [Akkermansiaceae bacterium]MDA8967203.1 TAT-variant-translocated molybdopterin oxidoreductase [Akkermansiaceae bacterium]MDB0056774.1 TAT-variant-translocated molybdopterin oxidoreductase [Akkermansiaceae bacterium]MDB4421563.1 TAT-variant-translocated molybdopterin oxidoreductase [Akkermansiaceae bacterium]